MKPKKGTSKNSSKRLSPFKPDHQYVNEALREYLKNGGEIKKIDIEKENSGLNYSPSSNFNEVDDFLRNP